MTRYHFLSIFAGIPLDFSLKFYRKVKLVLGKVPKKFYRKVKLVLGKDQEKAQSEKRFPLQKPRLEKTKLTMKTFRKPNEHLFSLIPTQLP